MSKVEFIKEISGMDEPVLEEHSLCDWELASCYLTVEDKNKTLILPPVKLALKAYLTEADCGLKQYEERELKMKLKYERWMHEVFGNYCTSKVSFS